MEEDFKVPLLPAPLQQSSTSPSSTANHTSTAPASTATTIAETVETKQTSAANNVPPQQPQSSTQQCPYREPPWSTKPAATDVEYRFEVLKSGKIIEEIKALQTKAVWKFGRLPENDFEMAHPTISRFHAILQYRPPSSSSPENEEAVDANKSADSTSTTIAGGWYIYDLGSTHGTFLNKQRIPARVYIRIRVGWMLRLGSSTRSYILQGPSDDEEPESELSVTELRAQRVEQQNAAIAAAAERERQQRAKEKEKEEEGISWGMAEDADETTDLTHNPYASTNNEELYLDDPKRTLRGYFEREDTPLEYKCDEMSVGSFVCRVELPIYDANGRPVIAEVVHKGRKKECVVQCALEACRILDRYGVLRQANQEPLKRRVKANDSDSDDDSFWDRTGDIERRKQRKANANTTVTLTYENLLQQEIELAQQMNKIEADIAAFQQKEKRLKATTNTLKANGGGDGDSTKDGDDLDNFMENLSDMPQLDKIEIRKLRLEQQRIKVEQQKLQRLIKLSKPTELPSYGEVARTNTLTGTSPSAATSNDAVKKKQLPLIGKRNQFSKFKIAKPSALPPSTKTTTTPTSTNLASDEEEMEDDSTNVECHKKLAVSKESPVADDNGGTDSSDNIRKHSIDAVTSTDKLQPPSVAPQKLDLRTNEDTNINVVKAEQKPPSPDTSTVADAADTPDTQSNSTPIASGDTEQVKRKQQQQRHRQRHKQHRPDVDVHDLDEHERSEKYAKWMPPANQTGDGYTSLNDKFGY